MRYTRRRGQGLVEYALLIVMLLGIFVGGVVVINLPINSLFCGVGNVISCSSDSGSTPTPPPTPPPTPRPTYREAVLATTPVAYWRLGEPATSAPRTLAYGHNGLMALYDVSYAQVGGWSAGVNADGTWVGSGGTPAPGMYHLLYYPHAWLDSWEATWLPSLIDLTTNSQYVDTLWTVNSLALMNTVVGAPGVGLSGTVYGLLPVHDEMGAADGAYGYSPTLGVPGLLTGDSNTAMAGAGLATLSAAAILPVPALTTWSFSWLEKIVAAAPSTWNAVFNHLAATGLLVARQTWTDLGYVCGTDRSWVAVTGMTLTPGETARLAVTYDGTSIRFYKNGTLIYTNARAGGAMDAANLWLGSWYSDGHAGSADTFDEFAVWNRALSDAEVAVLYAAGTGH